MSMSARVIRGSSDVLAFPPLHFPDQAGDTDAGKEDRALDPSRPERPNGRSRYSSRNHHPGNQTPSQLLAAAREEAEAMLAEASSQAAAIEAAARDAGSQAGRAEGLAAAGEELVDIKREYQESILKLDRLRHEMVGQCEQEIIRLVLEVAKKVVQREVSVDHEIVLTLIRVALGRISDNTPATIRVHHDDYQFLESRRNEFLSGENGIVHLVEDRSISRGGCVIETDFGQIDARIEQQFKEIERGFLGMG